MAAKLRDIDEAIALLPESSPYRVVLRGLWSADKHRTREDALAAAENALRAMSKPYWEEPDVVDEAIALTVLRAVFEVPAPAPASRWDRGVAKIPFSLIGSASPAVLALVRSQYAAAPAELRLDLLTLVASAGTQEGADVFAALVAEHGWPASPYARFFSELAKNIPYAGSLFPTLLEVPGEGEPTVELGDLLLRALRSGSVDAARIESTPMVRDLPKTIDDLFVQLAQGDEKVVNQLAMLLDLAGFVGGEPAAERLERALDLPHPWPIAFAIASLVRRKREVAEAPIARVAGDARALPVLYDLLRDLGAEGRIPPALRTREAFARADMVAWLAHPNELGVAPTAIEKMAVFTASQAGADVELYVWRFKHEDDPWKAAVSGPYRLDAPEGPLSGPSTFSKFEEWDRATAEGHARSVLDTLAEWRAAGI